METPNIDKVLPYLDKWGKEFGAGFVLNDCAVGYTEVAAEIHALLADRDAWKAKAVDGERRYIELLAKVESLASAVGVIDVASHSTVTLTAAIDEAVKGWKAKAAPVPPVRKLREVKGVKYDPKEAEFKWKAFGNAWKELRHLLVSYDVGQPNFTDADHAAIYALKDDPYEPVETLNDVLADMIDYYRETKSLRYKDWEDRARAAVAHECASANATVHAETPGAA